MIANPDRSPGTIVSMIGRTRPQIGHGD